MALNNSSLGLNSQSCHDPALRPNALSSDYIEMSYLAVAFILGAPLNLCALTKLNERRKAHGMTRILLLKLHLNVTDLMVIFVFISSRICELMTYEWRGGPTLCPIVKYGHFMALAISSNIIVCIAVDRLLTVLFPRDHTGVTAYTRVKWMALAAWVCAMVLALPQAYFYRTFTESYFGGGSFRQCAHIWKLEMYKGLCHYNYTSIAARDRYVSKYEHLLSYYQAAHIIGIFWIQVILVLACYFYILCWVCYHMGNGCTPYFRARSDTTASDMPDDTVNEIHKVESYLSPPPMFAGGNHQASAASGAGNSRRPTADDTSSMALPPPYSVVVTGAGSHRYSHRYSSRSSAQFPALIRAKRKILRSTLFIVMAYLLCWLPYSIMVLLQLFDHANYFKIEDQYYFLFSSVIFNSVINPFLYGGVFSMDDCKCGTITSFKLSGPVKHQIPILMVDKEVN